jgi:hypothetical protein
MQQRTAGNLAGLNAKPAPDPAAQEDWLYQAS